MRRPSLPIAGLLALSLLAAGCTGSGDGGPEKERPAVALVMKSLANEFFKTMEDGARRHQKEHADRYELVAVGIKDERDVARQIQLVEQMMARGVKAIVLAPADSKALVGVAKKALEKGIIVVNIDNRFDAAVLADKAVKIPFVGPDNRKGARMVGERVAKEIPAGAPVAILEGVPNAYNGIQRKLGFEDAAREAGWKIVSSQSGQWESDIANRVAAGIITEHPEVAAILCANDNMALGALAAVKSAGRAGKVLVAGFDNISAVRALVRAGDILCTADQHGDRLAVYGIEYALDMLASGREVADRETPVDLVTADSLK